MNYLTILQKAYLALLRLSPVQRLDVQGILCELRNSIAEITGMSLEETQDKIEELALNPTPEKNEIKPAKEWFKEICPNKHENYGMLFKKSNSRCHPKDWRGPTIVKQCHDCGATAPLGSEDWTRKA